MSTDGTDNDGLFGPGIAARLLDLAAPPISDDTPDSQTPTEATLIEIWRRELTLVHVSVHDNFVDVGGHSIAAVRCASAVHARFGVEVPLDAFFVEPGTIAALAELVDALRRAAVVDPAARP